MERVGWRIAIAGSAFFAAVILIWIVRDLFITAPVISPQRENSHLREDIEVEEYSIYSAVVADSYVRENPKLLVIVSQTSKDHSFDEREDQPSTLTESLPGLSAETLANFSTRNANRDYVKNAFMLPTKYVLISPEQLDHYFDPERASNGRNAWNAFYKEFPGSTGFIGFSKVGFNPTFDQAMVYLSHSCGTLCGTGYYYLLAKESGSWKVVKSYMRWIS